MIDDMIGRIINFLDAIYPMSEPLKDALRKNLIYKKFSKGDFLLRERQVCTNIYFIVNGLAKIYIIDEKGKEVIVWFMMKEDVMVAVDSFFNQQPSEQFIEALKETEVLYVSHECLYRFYREFPEFNIHRAALNEKYYQQSHKREITMKKYDCEGRYRYMFENHPQLLNEVQDSPMASYLKMDASTYSRVKKEALRSLMRVER